MPSSHRDGRHWTFVASHCFNDRLDSVGNTRAAIHRQHQHRDRGDGEMIPCTGVGLRMMQAEQMMWVYSIRQQTAAIATGAGRSTASSRLRDFAVICDCEYAGIASFSRSYELMMVDTQSSWIVRVREPFDHRERRIASVRSTTPRRKRRSNSTVENRPAKVASLSPSLSLSLSRRKTQFIELHSFDCRS
jgi:hypothetical protein